MKRASVLLFVILLAIPTLAQKGSIRSDARIEPLAAPAFRIISGTPLTIHVGADASFQVFNSSVPGQGQIYPSSCLETADMGIFADIGGVLYAPDFDQHNCSSATSNIDPSTPWTPVSLSTVSGTGTSGSPFTVTVVVDAGTTGVRMTATITYVNGENFFRINKSFTSTSDVAVKVFEGADIYLASSDSGVPFFDTTSSSPGGKDCGDPPTYTILFIPLTAANAHSARGFSTVWSEIGAGQLTNTVGNSCTDNGAALQWNRNLTSSGPTVIESAVSFGAIPQIAQFRVDDVTPASGAPGTSVNVTITGVGFQSGTTFSFGGGITVSNLVIVSGTQATATLQIAGNATLGFRDVVGTQSPDGLNSTLVDGFEVTGDPVPPGDIPTLSQWAMIMMALVLVGAALFTLRNH